ncbi:hypothetical protein VPG91_07715 [Nitrospirillum amazonense]|uniref:hypothetical protein n=1 Tax=Nitrospirillum amazonense TaxID=28077 RepID=UPI002DD42B6E|nr:hypothetical protein [Nitrospirillum amazonense]MEC4590870.1 hypothetical protein [Nitrospirillum amazonense]
MTELVNLPHAWRIREKRFGPTLPRWDVQWHFARSPDFSRTRVKSNGYRCHRLFLGVFDFPHFLAPPGCLLRINDLLLTNGRYHIGSALMNRAA